MSIGEKVLEILKENDMEIVHIGRSEDEPSEWGSPKPYEVTKIIDDEIKAMNPDTESIYWFMLGELESKCEDNDAVLKHVINAAFSHWNTTHGTKLKSRFMP